MRIRTLLTTATLALVALTMTASADAPYLGNGIKSGEPTQTSVTIWTRLTDRRDISDQGVPWPDVSPEKKDGTFVFTEPVLPEGHTLEEMAWSLPGADGEVRLSYWPAAASNMSTTTEWVAVSADHDYTRHFELKDLQPGTRYNCVVEARGTGQAEAANRVQGGFETAPAPSDATPVTFAVVTGQEFWRRDDDQKGHKIYPAMGQLKPNFFIHTGDIEYFDKAMPWCVNKEQARYKWNRIFGLQFQRDFHNQVTSYFLRDDHDTWQNDCWPTMQNTKMGEFTYAEGVDLFYEQVPGPNREKPWRTIRWGKDLQIWLPEGRDFRSPNTDPDGPDKTIWGEEQKAWFKRTVQESDATFRVLVSPTPVVGPDRENKQDNHANTTFKHEGDELRAFMAEQKNMVVLCGDRHWQYATIDPATGLREFCSGPTTNKHAGGFRQDLREPMHQYLNIVGGFLTCTVLRENDTPQLVLKHYDVNGNVINEVTLTPEIVVSR